MRTSEHKSRMHSQSLISCMIIDIAIVINCYFVSIKSEIMDKIRL